MSWDQSSCNIYLRLSRLMLVLVLNGAAVRTDPFVLQKGAPECNEGTKTYHWPCIELDIPFQVAKSLFATWFKVGAQLD